MIGLLGYFNSYTYLSFFIVTIIEKDDSNVSLIRV